MAASCLTDSPPRVGYLYSHFPPEILYAFGRLPVRILPTGGNAADAEAYLHKNFCALTKVILAGLLDGATDFEGVVFTDHCDAQRRLADVWRAYVRVPVLAFLDLPRRLDPLGQAYYAAALSRAVSELEERFGEKLSAEALADSIRVYNRQRELWSALRAAWLEGRISGLRYRALRDLRWTADPALANGALEDALSHNRERAPSPSTRPRILVMGSVKVPDSLALAIEENGRARIVAEDTACDERAVHGLIPAHGSRDDLLQALAVRHLDSPAPRLRSLPARLAYLARLADARQVNGVICSYYKFCDLFLAEFPVVQRFFQARKIEVLLLEDEGDQALSGQARTRVDAFLEILSQ